MGKFKDLKYSFRLKVRKRIEANIRKQKIVDLDTKEYSTPGNIISESFIWGDTKEGVSYWSNQIAEAVKYNHKSRRKPNNTMINHLMSLPKKYRTLAIRNFINAGAWHTRFSRSEKYSTNALMAAFVWQATPEGFEFWDAAYTEVFQSISRKYKIKK